jgi:hypothetical protein
MPHNHAIPVFLLFLSFVFREILGVTPGPHLALTPTLGPWVMMVRLPAVHGMASLAGHWVPWVMMVCLPAVHGMASLAGHCARGSGSWHGFAGWSFNSLIIILLFSMAYGAQWY